MARTESHGHSVFATFLPPIELASIYVQGLSTGRWATQLEAAATLNVKATKISRGVRVSALPRVILDSFPSCDAITEDCAKILLNIVKVNGVEKIVRLATLFTSWSGDRRTSAILAALSGKEPIDARRNETPNLQRVYEATILPRDIASEFYAGISLGKWKFISEYAKKKDRTRASVTDALAIDGLDFRIQLLFRYNDSLTLTVGRKLLTLQRKIGKATLQERAASVQQCASLRPARNVLDELAQNNVVPIDDLDFPVVRGHDKSYLFIQSEHWKKFIKYEMELEHAVRRVIQKRVIATVYEEVQKTIKITACHIPTFPGKVIRIECSDPKILTRYRTSVQAAIQKLLLSRMKVDFSAWNIPKTIQDQSLSIRRLRELNTVPSGRYFFR